nr:hypothetical protein [Tanacetum cinerariifolium]
MKLIVIVKKKFILSRDCCIIPHLLVYRKNLFLKILILHLNLSPFPIPVEDSDSLIEEIDLSFTSDDPMPSGIEEDDYDSERDIFILEEFLSNDSLSLPENESFHFDIPSSSRPPAKPPDSNSGILNVKVMGDIFEHNVPMPRLMLTLVPNQEKSPDLLSHLGHEASHPSIECPMMIYGKNTPILDYSWNLKTHAKGFFPSVFISSASLGNHDSDSFMEEIDLSFTLDDPMPLGIEEDDYDSERDILILKELLSNDSLSLPENESFHFDISSSSRPPAKPPDVFTTSALFGNYKS